MGELYANVIVDISHERVDRPFQYRVPEALRGKIQVGSPVSVPFGAGNRRKMPSEKIKKRSQPGRTSRHLRHKMD